MLDGDVTNGDSSAIVDEMIIVCPFEHGGVVSLVDSYFTAAQG